MTLALRCGKQWSRKLAIVSSICAAKPAAFPGKLADSAKMLKVQMVVARWWRIRGIRRPLHKAWKKPLVQKH